LSRSVPGRAPDDLAVLGTGVVVGRQSEPGFVRIAGSPMTTGPSEDAGRPVERDVRVLEGRASRTSGSRCATADADARSAPSHLGLVRTNSAYAARGCMRCARDASLRAGADRSSAPTRDRTPVTTRGGELRQTRHTRAGPLRGRFGVNRYPRPMEQSLSRDAYDRLSQELAERTTSRRLEISHRIEEAREHGDIKENADYDAAKNEQGHNEARIRQIEAILRDAVIVEQGNAEVVEPGVLVELRQEGDDATEIYLVGSIEERHDTYEIVSTSSPLGQALLGAVPGATVTYQGPRRELSVVVVSVRLA